MVNNAATSVPPGTTAGRALCVTLEMHRASMHAQTLAEMACGSGESSYRRTRNGELSPFSARLFDLKLKNAGFKNE